MTCQEGNKLNRAILIIFMTHEEAVAAMAVASFLEQMGNNDTLLLLHNGTTGPSFRRKYGSIPRVEYFEEPRNLGVASGRNLLLQQATCLESDLVFLVDSDAIAPRDYLDRISVRQAPSCARS